MYPNTIHEASLADDVDLVEPNNPVPRIEKERGILLDGL